MFHCNRIWCLHEGGTPEELAEKLAQHTWTLCTAFYVTDYPQYLFLNDSTHEDAAGEWAVVKREGDRLFQIESITFSWCSFELADSRIRDCILGVEDDEAQPVTAVIQTPQEHGTCRHCA